MSGKKPKATRKRVISCFAQIVQEHIPGWKIEEIASGEKVKARKAAVKVHMVANVANRLPHFCVFGKAKDHDSKKEDELFGSLKAGDIGIADRAYNHFKALYRQTTRGVFFVVREKAGMKHKVVKKVPKKDLGANILSDETIRLTGQRTSKEYPGELRMVQARVQVEQLGIDLEKNYNFTY